jgi:ABC-2 type transport system permease protein
MKFINKSAKVLGLGLAIAKAEFKLKNEGSYFGVFWYLLNPFLVFLLLFSIFSDRLGGSIYLYPLYLLLGVVMFNFFQTATIESARSIIDDHRFLIKSINFPRESIVVAIIVKNALSHLLEICLLLIFFLFFSVPLWGLLFYILLLPFFILFTFGVSLMLAATTVYFVDMKNIWSFAVRLIWFATPIFYAIEGQARLFYFNLFNPMYYFITAGRDILIYLRPPEFFIIIGLIFYAATFFGIGLIIFQKLSSKLPEKI